MQDNLTPEEKLLRLIRGENKKKPLQQVKADSKVEEAVFLRPASVKNTQKPKKIFNLPILKFELKYLTVFSLKNIILALLLCSFLYFIFSLVYSFFGLRTLQLPKIAQHFKILEDVDLKRQTKPLDDYLQVISKRKIFEGSGQGQASAGTVATSEILKNLSLVGIVSGDNPQAIIEDKNQQKTYYLTKGQSISDFQVADIQESKIILNYNGQKYELNI